jgi:hypothetical protein
MKTYGALEEWLHAFITSALDGGQWPASRHRRFNPRCKKPKYPWPAGWVGSRGSLGAVVNKKIISLPLPGRILVTVLTELLRYWFTHVYFFKNFSTPSFSTWSSVFHVRGPSSVPLALAGCSSSLGSTYTSTKQYTMRYPKVSGLAAWSENCKWYSFLPLGAVISLYSASV